LLKHPKYYSVKNFVFLHFLMLGFIVGVLKAPSVEEEPQVTAILAQVNKYRKKHGMHALKMNDELNAVARKHSVSMASGRRKLGHAGFKQRQLDISRFLKYSSIAENVAYGPTTASELVGLWANSPSHRQNMLGNYTYTGIGIAKNRQGRIFYTQIFLR
jgi:uncharacterized protein YkwD